MNNENIIKSGKILKHSKFSKIIIVPYNLLLISYSYIIIEIIFRQIGIVSIYRWIYYHYQYVSIIECLGFILLSLFIFIKYKNNNIKQEII